MLTDSGPIGIDELPEWIAANKDRITAHLDQYFRPGADTKSVYQGQHFEWFQRRSALTKFTAEDLAAIGALSVSVPAQTGRILISDVDGQYSRLLTRCQKLISLVGSGVDLVTCPKSWLVDDDSPFVELYGVLRELDGVGPVVCSKLMASKFPALIPIRDQLVERLLGMGHSTEWWLPIRTLLRAGAPTVVETLRGLTGEGHFADVSTTRRLDVALWMEARSRGLRATKAPAR